MSTPQVIQQCESRVDVGVVHPVLIDDRAKSQSARSKYPGDVDHRIRTAASGAVSTVPHLSSREAWLVPARCAPRNASWPRPTATCLRQGGADRDDLVCTSISWMPARQRARLTRETSFGVPKLFRGSDRSCTWSTMNPTAFCLSAPCQHGVVSLNRKLGPSQSTVHRGKRARVENWEPFGALESLILECVCSLPTKMFERATWRQRGGGGAV